VDRICIDYAGYVAAVEWHTDAAFPLHSPEGRAKWFLYPPPYNGGYATPWAWIDGKSRGYQYTTWAGYVGAQTLVPTDISMVLSGTYDSAANAGTVQAVLFNSGMMPVDAALQVVITEDSLNYTGPNGDPWHNHVCRDYVPNQNGTPVSIPSAGYDTVELAYTTNPAWRKQFLKVVAYVQNMTTQPDSSKPVLQGGSAPLLSFVGVEEPRVPASFYANVTARVGPNPCRSQAEFRLTGPAGKDCRLGIYSPDDRLVRTLAGSFGSGATDLVWDRTDAEGQRVARGVYSYRVTATGTSATGKLVLAD
jgi:hypothetical protein